MLHKSDLSENDGITGGLSQEGVRKQLARFQQRDSALWDAMNDVVRELRTSQEPPSGENSAGWLIQATFDHLERNARRRTRHAISKVD